MNDIALELAKLHLLTGADFIRQLKLIVAHHEFHPIAGEDNIYSVGGETGEDYANLLNAARKAVELGNIVYILPNPKDIRTADFIFVQKGIYKMYDLKTIYGKSSVSSRLGESIGQTNRVLLNIVSECSPSVLARSVKLYFERNPQALEVLVFRGRKTICISRHLSQSSEFYKVLMKRYWK